MIVTCDFLSCRRKRRRVLLELRKKNFVVLRARRLCMEYYSSRRMSTQSSCQSPPLSWRVRSSQWRAAGRKDYATRPTNAAAGAAMNYSTRINQTIGS
jgi:hypothetical protein